MPRHDLIVCGEEPGFFHAVEERVEGAGADAVSVARQLGDELGPVDLPRGRVVEDVHRNGPASEFPGDIHPISLADIVTRYQGVRALRTAW